MSNKTELPDLDRLEALARAATPVETDLYGDRYFQGPYSQANFTQEQDEFFHAANPATVLALITLARRAQPEDEVQQAVPLEAISNLVNDAIEAASKNGANSVSMPDDYVAVAHFVAYPEQYGFAPAALCMLGGALCRACHGTGQDCDNGPDGAPVPCICLDCKGTGLAAQSQGAQK